MSNKWHFTSHDFIHTIMQWIVGVIVQNSTQLMYMSFNIYYIGLLHLKITYIYKKYMYIHAYMFHLWVVSNTFINNVFLSSTFSWNHCKVIQVHVITNLTLHLAILNPRFYLVKAAWVELLLLRILCNRNIVH